MNIGKYFNPSRKVDFKLYVNDTLIQSGYVKMLDIDFINKNLWRYNIALFGELGNFINLLDNKTLKDVLQSYKNNYIQYSDTFPLATSYKWYTLDNLFRSKTELTRYTLELDDLYNTDYTIDKYFKWDSVPPNVYLDLIDAENGLYSKGDKIRAYNGDLDLPIPLTEQELCLKNEVRQRLGFYIDKLFMDIINSLGYTVTNIGGDWINKENPYWYNTITNANIPDKIDDNWERTAVGASYFEQFDETAVKRYTYAAVPNSVSNSNFDFISLGVPPNRFSKYGPNDNDWDVYHQPIRFRNIYPNKFRIEFNQEVHSPKGYLFMAKLANNDILPGEWVPITTTNEVVYFRIRQVVINGDFNKTNQNSYVTKDILLTNQHWVDESVGRYYFRFVVESGASIPEGRLEIHKDGNWVTVDEFMNSGIFDFDKNPWIDYQNFSVVYRITKSMVSFNAMTNGTNSRSMAGVDFVFGSEFPGDVTFTYNIKSVGDFGPGSLVSYWDILPSITIKDFILSYVKMFGLYLDIDNDKKEIKLLTRNEFYGDEKIVDWDEKLCLDRNIEIKPLSFDSKFIRLSYNESDNNLSKEYKEKFNNIYGQMLLNTGYEFNNDTYDLFEDVIFDDYISVAQSVDFYGDNDTPKVIPHLYEGELRNSSPSDGQFLFFASPPFIKHSGGGTITKGKIPSLDTQSPSFVIPSVIGSAFFCWFNEGNFKSFFSRIDMSDYNLWAQTITVDSDWNVRISYEDSNAKYGPYGKPAIFGHRYNPTTHYYPSPHDIQYSLDFARPFTTYHNYDYPQESTIYDRIWKKFLEDRYDVNTKVMTAYFYLNDIDFNTFNFNNFIYVKNKLWVVNRIVDWDVVSNEPVKVELISVNNIKNYSEGVNLD